MTFLAPIPAIIAAAVALPALLLFYFLKLRRRPVRVSSTLLWMQATSDLQVNVPFRMIRPSWLLLLQLLILVSLLVALARPAVQMDSAPVGRAVILIDRSASMSARDGVGGEAKETRLDEAKRRALVIADRLARSGGTLVSVVAYAADARTLTPFTSDRGAVREAIRAVQPADQPDNLAGALDLVSAQAMGERTDSSDETIAPERMLVVLVGDGGTPAPPGLTLDNADWRFESVGPLPGGPPPLDNVGIAAISARRDYQDPATVRLFARVINAGPEPVATVLTLTIDGAVVDRRPLEIPASSGPAPSQVGETSASFEFQNSGGGVAVASLGRTDSLSADNAGAVVLSEPTRPGVLLVTPAGEPGRTGAAPGWLIGDVLAELDLRPFRTVTAAEYERLASEGGLGPYALVVFDRVRPIRVPPVASISFGAGLPSPLSGLPNGAPGGSGGDVAIEGAARFLSWDRAHPILRDVALDSVVIARSIDTLRAIDLGGESKRILTELARSENGPLIELVEDGPVRRIVVGFELAQSNWPLSVSFAIFLSNAVDYLTLRGEAEAGREFTTSEPVRLRVGPDAASELTLRGPATEAIRPTREPGAAQVTVGIVEHAGLYSVEGAGQGGDAFVAVNLVDQTESAIRTSRELTIAGRAVASASGGAGPREVWPWFVLAAALLLAGEWFLHAFMMKV